MPPYRLLPALALALLAVTPAQAVDQQKQAFSRWRIQDRCIADAQKQHPDRDLASQQARDASVDKCLKDHGLPPREHLAPDPAPASDKPADKPS